MARSIFSKALTLVMAACMLFMLCACNALNTDQGAIENTLSRELDSIKYRNTHTVEELSKNMDLDMLSDYDIKGAELMNMYLDGFDYKIDSIKVAGNTAQVQLTLTCKSFSDFEALLTESVKNAETKHELDGMTLDDFNAYINKLVTNAVNAAEVKQAEPVTLEYVKKGNIWEPRASASNAIVRAMMSN